MERQTKAVIDARNERRDTEAEAVVEALYPDRWRQVIADMRTGRVWTDVRDVVASEPPGPRRAALIEEWVQKTTVEVRVYADGSAAWMLGALRLDLSVGEVVRRSGDRVWVSQDVRERAETRRAAEGDARRSPTVGFSLGDTARQVLDVLDRPPVADHSPSDRSLTVRERRAVNADARRDWDRLPHEGELSKLNPAARRRQ